MFENSINLGALGAPPSTTRYYLSQDLIKGTGDILLGGTRAVPALAPSGQFGDVSNGSAAVTIPSTTAAGTYHVLACADDLKAVAETSETNNCAASFGSVQVTR